MLKKLFFFSVATASLTIYGMESDKSFAKAVSLIKNFNEGNSKEEFKELLNNNPSIIYNKTPSDDFASRHFYNGAYAGQTILHIVANSINVEAVELVLDKSNERNLNMKDTYKKSPFEYAFRNYVLRVRTWDKFGLGSKEKILQLFVPKLSKQTVIDILVKNEEIIEGYQSTDSKKMNDELLKWLNSDEFNPQCPLLTSVTEIRQKDLPKAKTVLLSFKMLAKKWGIQIGPRYIRNNILCMALQQESEILQLRESKPNQKLEISDFIN